MGFFRGLAHGTLMSAATLAALSLALPPVEREAVPAAGLEAGGSGTAGATGRGGRS